MLGDLASNQDALGTVQAECANIYKGLSGGSSLQSLIMGCDVTVEEQVNALVDAAVKELGGLNVMVANAGVIKNNLLLDGKLDDA
ncbi:hypothetical protein FRC08_016015 [Ceratobasidium sp. 394]|nr:hypothetical protein FRC08_016015 [Ceratobasidium sp. 394]